MTTYRTSSAGPVQVVSLDTEGPDDEVTSRRQQLFGRIMAKVDVWGKGAGETQPRDLTRTQLGWFMNPESKWRNYGTNTGRTVFQRSSDLRRVARLN